MILLKGRSICPNPANIVLYNRILFGISPSFISCVDGILWCKNDIVMSSLNLFCFFWCLFSDVIFKLPNIDGPVMSSVFCTSQGNVSLQFVRKPKKRGGKRGRTGGGGIFLQCLLVHCNPSMFADNQLLVLKFLSFFPYRFKAKNMIVD